MEINEETNITINKPIAVTSTLLEYPCIPETFSGQQENGPGLAEVDESCLGDSPH